VCAKKCKMRGKCAEKNCDKNTCRAATAPVSAQITAPPLTAKSAGVQIAVKKPQSNPAGKVVSIDDPASAIKDGGAEFYALYTQYLALRALAAPLNGLPQAAPLPDDVKVTKVTIEFSVSDKPYVAEIPGATTIAEVSVLLGAGLRKIIEQMYQTLYTLGHVATNMQNLVQQAVTARSPSAVSLSNKTEADEKAI
jgi:hypothetical protein